MHAFLIVGSSREHRQEEVLRLLRVHHIPSTQECAFFIGHSSSLESGAIGIDDVRALQRQLWQQSRCAGIIVEADLLTLAAQHALLKTLEDPAQNMVILSAPGESRLLPTLRSRCQIIRLLGAKDNSSDPTQAQAIEQFLRRMVNAVPADRIASWYQQQDHLFGKKQSMLSVGSSKQTAARVSMETIIQVLHEKRGQGSFPAPYLSDQNRGAMLAHAATAWQKLDLNCNPALVLEQFLLDIPRIA